MTTSAPLSFSISSEDLKAHLAQPSSQFAHELASLINKHFSSGGSVKGEDTAALDRLLATNFDEIYTLTFPKWESIDDYITFLSFTALQINSSVHHLGDIAGEERPAYTTVALRPADGPAVIGEHLSKALYALMWRSTSRAYTPDADRDCGHPKAYYTKATRGAAILARAFAFGVESFKKPLWRNIEDVFVKVLFSDGLPEPGVFVVLAVILLGAGKEIREFMGAEEIGQGKAWVWYSDLRVEEDARWGWEDVVKAVKLKPGIAMSTRLPEYVKDSFELAKKHIGDGLEVPESLDSRRLATEAFEWATSDL